MGANLTAIPTASKRKSQARAVPPPDVILLKAVDKVPETRGMGVMLITHGVPRCLRNTSVGHSTIIFEYRRSPLSKTKHADTKPRNNQTSPAAEWFSMGLNCGGAALAWIGVVGAGAAEPITGGMDTPATIILWGGAMAASGQCAASFTRVTALETGHKKFVEDLDNSTAYVWTMRGLDVVGLLGVKGAIVDIVKTREALKLSGVEWERAVAAQISRQQRRTITEKLALEGSKRVAAQSISLVVKQRILAAVAAGVGMATSTSVGATHDLVVWIMSPQPKK